MLEREWHLEKFKLAAIQSWTQLYSSCRAKQSRKQISRLLQLECWTMPDHAAPGAL